MTDAATPHVKGAALGRFLDWYVQRFGTELLGERLAVLPPDVAGAFEVRDGLPHVIASRWYPIVALHALIDEMLADYSPAARTAFAREAARHTAESSLRGIYRFLFETIMTPERYVRRAHKLFSRFYDTGTMTKLQTAEHEHTTIITDWNGHHPVLCDVLLYGGEFIYPSLGCRDVRVERVSCVATGGSDCRYVVRWS